ncbi:ABC transporter permease [Confluentibacter citreus]|uniref:ABC transporter permease n=1 Tax=Confluentibacter citreus TaxID=2007307 RepID=UPI000C28F39F|nr:ABC transporter permease [Confluentibacter citreus]
MALETRIYQKENQLRIGKLLKDSLQDIYTSRFLSRQLAVRDISAQYRQSYLGILWAFIMPLTTAVMWIFLNSSGTIRLSATGVPYPVYAFSGTLIWSIITESINAPLSNTNAAKGLLTKLNFPKEALIISGIYKLLFNSAIKVLLLVVFVFVFGIGFHWSLLLFPFVLLGALVIGTALGLFITPLGMLYKDVGKLIRFGLTFLMYVTPVVYAIPKTGLMKTVMTYNPMTPIILTTRDFVTGQNPEHLSYFLIVVGCSIPLFVIGLVFYRLSIPIIVERSSA